MGTHTFLIFWSHLSNILLPTAPDISSFFNLVWLSSAKYKRDC